MSHKSFFTELSVRPEPVLRYRDDRGLLIKVVFKVYGLHYTVRPKMKTSKVPVVLNWYETIYDRTVRELRT